MYVINGEKFTTRNALAEYISKKYNIPFCTVISRLKANYTIDQCIKAKVNERINRSKDEININYNGKNYKSLTDFCKKEKIVYRKIVQYFSRKKLKYTEETLKTYIEVVKKNEIIVFGIVFKSTERLALHYGVSPYYIRKYYSESNNMEKSVLLAMDHGIIYEDNSYPSLISLSSYFNANLGVVSRRIKSGWTLSDSLSIPLVIKKPGKKVIYNDKIYYSMSDACIDYKIQPSFVSGEVFRYKKEFCLVFDAIIKYFANIPNRENLFLHTCPYAIINDKIYNRLEDISEDFNLPYNRIKTTLHKHKSDLGEGLKYLARLDKPLYYDPETNSYISRSDYEIKYKDVRIDLKDKVTFKITVKVYPKLENIYDVINFKREYKKYMRNLFNINQM